MEPTAREAHLVYVDPAAPPSKERPPSPGDRLEDLYRLHAKAAVRFAFLLTGERELAQDLVQDAFLTLSDRLDKIDSLDAFVPYLRTTVLNLTRMHFRHRDVERAYLRRERGADGDVVVVDTSYVEMRQSLFRLPYRQRAAIVLRFYEDLPEREIAQLLGCRPGTVKSLLSRGLASLRTETYPPNEEGENHAR